MELPNMHDSDARFQFIQGLKYEARLQVMMKEPSTLFEAYKQAEYFEMTIDTSKTSLTLPRPLNLPRLYYLLPRFLSLPKIFLTLP
ncbi:unnamed protein product [Cunninghamella blakesleeana]